MELGLHDCKGPSLSFHIEAAIRHLYCVPLPRLDHDLMLLKVPGTGRGQAEPDPAAERRVKARKTVQVLYFPRSVVPRGRGARQPAGRIGSQEAAGARPPRARHTVCNNSHFWDGELPVNTLYLTVIDPQCEDTGYRAQGHLTW